MRRWITTLLMTFLAAGSCVSYANANTGQVSFEAGYRHDNINWKHRFPSDDPFLSSSTKFEDLDIFQIGIHGRSTIGCNFYLRASAYWGWILDGDFRRDVNTYFSASEGYFCNRDNFKFGFSDDRKSTIDDKYVYGVSAAIGYPFFFCDCTMIVAPVIGYAFDEQKVEVDSRGFNFCERDGFFVPGYGSGDCCRNQFTSRWYGPFVGIDFDYNPWNSCVNFYAELEYHWGSFRGKRSNPDGFDFFGENSRRSHDARGWVFAAGIDYDLCNCWTVGLSVKFQDWSASRHHRQHESFDDYGYSDRCFDGRSRTNHKWHSYAINVTVGREF